MRVETNVVNVGVRPRCRLLVEKPLVCVSSCVVLRQEFLLESNTSCTFRGRGTATTAWQISLHRRRRTNVSTANCQDKLYDSWGNTPGTTEISVARTGTVNIHPSIVLPLQTCLWKLNCCKKGQFFVGEINYTDYKKRGVSIKLLTRVQRLTSFSQRFSEVWPFLASLFA